jgi:hypothetical protein
VLLSLVIPSLLVQAPVFLTDKWQYFGAFLYTNMLVLLYVFFSLFISTKFETWWLHKVLRQPVLDRMREAIRRLSPLVEERSGYRLRFEAEPDGCCLGGTSGYVCFELANRGTSLAVEVEDERSGEAPSAASLEQPLLTVRNV